MLSSKPKYPDITTELIDLGNNTYVFSVSPLMPGYAYTIGNSLRRVLLSSIPGCGVVKARIADASHEYQGLEGVKEDVLTILLNLKDIRSKILNDEEKVTLTLNKKKSGIITAGDFKVSKQIEIINSDAYICTLTKDIDFTIEVEIAKGFGYRPIEEIDFVGSLDPQDLLVDTLFSPVFNVSLEVTKVRVGDKTNFDKLDIHFETDGSVDPKQVVDYTLDFLLNIFNSTKASFSQVSLKKPTPKTDSADLTLKSGATIALSQEADESPEIKITPKIDTALSKSGITTMRQLTEVYLRGTLSDLPGLTPKQIQKIEIAVQKYQEL